jgi:hypothetical protein
MNTEVLIPLLLTTCVAVAGWYAAHRLPARRNLANKRRELRVQYLIEATGASNSPGIARSADSWRRTSNGLLQMFSSLGRPLRFSLRRNSPLVSPLKRRIRSIRF